MTLLMKVAISSSFSSWHFSLNLLLANLNTDEKAFFRPSCTVIHSDAEPKPLEQQHFTGAGAKSRVLVRSRVSAPDLTKCFRSNGFEYENSYQILQLP
jgi:hypothetical protein